MLLKVPIDIVPPEQLPEVINSFLATMGNSEGNADCNAGGSAEGTHRSRNLVLLSLWDLLRARRNKEYRSYIFNADLIIPISKSIVSGAKFLTGKKPARYMPFNFVISLLSLLERREYPLYLLGGKSQVLKRAEKNIRSTFPRIKVVGRCVGSIRKQEEPAIIEAIRKTSPSLLLAGEGIRGGELWIARNDSHLNSGFRIWCSDLFDIFAEKKKRPSDTIFDKGLESIGFCMRNPLKFFRIFAFIRYNLLLLFYKLFVK